jgi:hypothetical protein
MTTKGARSAFLRSYHIPSILLHYPRLVRSMRRLAILDEMTAASCIRDLKAGRRWSSEAVNRYGGTHKVATDACKYRRAMPPPGKGCLRWTAECLRRKGANDDK